MTIDTDKAFDSLDHFFLISTLETFGFGKTFIEWIKIFLNEWESHVTNEGITTKYFKLDKSYKGPCASESFYTLLRDAFYVNKKQ